MLLSIHLELLRADPDPNEKKSSHSTKSPFHHKLQWKPCARNESLLHSSADPRLCCSHHHSHDGPRQQLFHHSEVQQRHYVWHFQLILHSFAVPTMLSNAPCDNCPVCTECRESNTSSTNLFYQCQIMLSRFAETTIIMSWSPSDNCACWRKQMQRLWSECTKTILDSAAVTIALYNNWSVTKNRCERAKTFWTSFKRL